MRCLEKPLNVNFVVFSDMIVGENLRKGGWKIFFPGIILLLFLSFQAKAQVLITGKVTDDKTKLPLYPATIWSISLPGCKAIPCVFLCFITSRLMILPVMLPIWYSGHGSKGNIKPGSRALLREKGQNNMKIG